MSRPANVKVTRRGAGSYLVVNLTDGREWVVNQVEELRGEWVAYSGDVVHDPFLTLREAVEACAWVAP